MTKYDARTSLAGFDYTPEDWMLDGNCAKPDTDPELWFAPPESRLTRQAIEICRTCPLRTRCLQYALETDTQWGVWGATTETQRRKIKENNDAA